MVNSAGISVEMPVQQMNRRFKHLKKLKKKLVCLMPTDKTAIKLAIASDPINMPSGKDPFQDDQELMEELRSMGAVVEIMDWKNTETDWNQFDAIFISSTWDIPSHGEAFIQWIRDCNSDRNRVINDGQLIIDNVIKSRYLSRLIKKFGVRVNSGMAITPSYFIGINESEEDQTNPIGNRSLKELFEELDAADPDNWQDRDIVMKPIVSADGNNTFLYKRMGRNTNEKQTDFILHSDEEAEKIFHHLLSSSPRGIILQPYIKAVEEGEYCLVFFNDKYSHAIQKRGGFKNHSIKERRFIPEVQLPKNMVSFATQIIHFMQECYHQHALIRTRIDFLYSNGQIVLCELECTEPNTNLQSLPADIKTAVLKSYASAIYREATRLKAAIND